MAENVFKPAGATKASKPTAGGAVVREVPVIGIVKNTIDPTRQGRIQVYITDMGGTDPDDSKNWVTVRYMSPFYGLTLTTAPNTGAGDYVKNPSSYGMWNSPPDIGTQVICLFVNGDMNFGFYIGCIPEPEALQMVPAIGSSETVVANEGEAKSYGGATQLPVTNLNSNNKSEADGNNYLNSPKPVHSYMASILSQQGLIRDNIRGPITSSAQRESPSRVGWGINTPGRPIYEGGFTDETIANAASKNGQQSGLNVINRRAGHSIVMDDGDLVGRDQLIRLRSALGHQILMSDDGQCLFIVHSNGQSWIELGKEGTIDMYATNSVNIRTQGDLNLHADNNVNIQAKKDLNIAAENINITSDKSTGIRVGSDYKTYVVGNSTTKADGKLSISSNGDISMASGGIAYVNGSKVNLNTGATSLTPQTINPPNLVAHTDTLFDSTKGFAPAPGKLLSIVSRAPAHMPWINAGQGVDVKVSLNASDNLPSAPSAPVAAANQSVNPTPANPPTVATNATVPDTGAVSQAVDTNTTASLVSAVATNAAASAGAVVTAGTGIIQTAAGATAAVGALAQTAQQMASSNILKPGSEVLVQGMIQAGKTVEAALTPNMFTGQQGAENLGAFVNNIPAQVQSQVANFQKAQTALTSAGVMTGTESPTQIAGPILAAAQNGVGPTVDFIKNAGTNLATGLASANSINGAVANSMSAGAFAGALPNSLPTGLNSVLGSLGGIKDKLALGIEGLTESVKGAAGAAFSAVTGAYKSLKANVPQNLRVQAEANAEKTEDAPAALTGAAGVASGAIGAATGAATDAIGTVTGAIKSAADKLTSMNPSSVVLSGIPGGEKALSNVVNANLPNAPLLGVGEVSAAIKNISTSVQNNVSGSALSISAATGLGGLGSAVNTLKDKLISGSQTLASLATTGLPKSVAAGVNAAISSISSNGPQQISLPSVTVGATNRGEMDSQVNAVLGNLKIPVPNFNGNPATFGKGFDQVALDKQNKLNQERDRLRDKSFDLQKDERDAVYNLSNLKQTLPAGDPSITAAEEKVKAVRQEIQDLNKQLESLFS
jgi:hypothetical protein